ncbi:hypothetical protein SDC9_114298 [bioreactor metagenome]|uniref:Uncharacterized protein n=1 Tax=bioreactor metagenome TaxID=1076179 RepID=A0A645BPR4_9ZZZZ
MGALLSPEPMPQPVIQHHCHDRQSHPGQAEGQADLTEKLEGQVGVVPYAQAKKQIQINSGGQFG